MTTHDHPGRVVTFEAAHRTEPRLEPAMVALDPIVGVPLSVVEHGGHELIDDHPHRRGPVGHNFGGLAVSDERLTSRLPSRTCVAFPHVS
jgi:hypothetical protein